MAPWAICSQSQELCVEAFGVDDSWSGGQECAGRQGPGKQARAMLPKSGGRHLLLVPRDAQGGPRAELEGGGLEQLSRGAERGCRAGKDGG